MNSQQSYSLSGPVGVLCTQENQSAHQRTANQQMMMSRGMDSWSVRFEDQQRQASEQYLRQIADKNLRDDEAFRKICKDAHDFWNSPIGVFCEIMQLVAIALPILVPAAIILMMLNHAASR